MIQMRWEQTSAPKLFWPTLAVALALVYIINSDAAWAGAQSTCVECHAKATPQIVKDWNQSKMARTMDCSGCHGTAHHEAGDARLATMPSGGTCSTCHARQAREFAAGKHNLAWEAMGVVPRVATQPAAITDTGCAACHKIGRDGGKCDSCHTRHKFSKAEANKPEACVGCHRGDHAQLESWESSKHGLIYAAEGDTGRAPKCQTCHMPSGNHKALTAWGFYGLRGEEADPRWKENRDLVAKIPMRLGPGKAPNAMRGSMDEWNTLRSEMVATCKNCHSESFAREQLARGDAVLKATDAVTADIVRIVEGLLKDGLMSEPTVNVLYREILPHRMNAYIGAFHGSPEFVYEAGWQKLTQDLVKLKDEEKRLRKKTE